MKLSLILLGLTSSLTAFGNGRAYLNLEDGKVASVFNQPGKHWKNCPTSNGCQAVAWPTNAAEIEVISAPRSMRVEDPTTGRLQTENYVQIRYKYNSTSNGRTTTQEGTGWIDAAYVRNSRPQSLYSAQSSRPSTSTTAPAAAKAEDCPPTPPARSGSGSAASVANTVAPLAAALGQSSVDSAAAALLPHVGKCVINPSRPPTNYAAGNPFDSYVMPHLRTERLPQITKENGQPMTRQDFIDIDALTRTLYAEMAACYKHGLHYPMTVAKIVVNRANASNRHGEFIRGTHATEKGVIARVATTPSQFSLWLKKIGGRTNNSLRQALCPPSSENKAFWTGNNPPPYETDIWDSTMKIATEAVLFPQQFARRTGQVRQFFYTSGMSGFYKMNQVHPSIGNQRVDRNACVQVWQEGS